MSDVPLNVKAKQALRDALAQYGGDPNQSAIASAIHQLVALNPTSAPAKNFDLMQGQWRLISAPSFPDGERQEDGTYLYSLGRLAFNMFQPQHLKLVIQDVLQPVLPIEATQAHTHDIVVIFETVSAKFPRLRGQVRNLGICQPGNDTSVQVKFTGGVLEPLEETELNQWKRIFNEASSPRLNLKEKMQEVLLKMMFGLSPVSAMDAQTGRLEFHMRRSPKGSLEILYLDEELRITQGQKGTVLVCERVKPLRS